MCVATFQIWWGFRGGRSNHLVDHLVSSDSTDRLISLDQMGAEGKNEGLFFAELGESKAWLSDLSLGCQRGGGLRYCLDTLIPPWERILLTLPFE